MVVLFIDSAKIGILLGVDFVFLKSFDDLGRFHLKLIQLSVLSFCSNPFFSSILEGASFGRSFSPRKKDDSIGKAFHVHLG